MIDIHLFDANAREEEALCGAEVSVLDLTTVQDYLERRRHDLSLPTVCSRCKVSAIPFVRMRRSALIEEVMTDEAEIYRRLADTLSRETDPDLSRPDWMTSPQIHIWAFLRTCLRGAVGTPTRC